MRYFAVVCLFGIVLAETVDVKELLRESERLRAAISKMSAQLDKLESITSSHVSKVQSLVSESSASGSKSTNSPSCDAKSKPAIERVSFENDVDYFSGPKRLYYLTNVISDAEIEHLLDLTLPRLQTSEVMGYSTEIHGTGDSTDTKTRSSETAYLEPDEEAEDTLMSRLIFRLHALAGTPRSFGESLQVTKYRPGTNYTFHFDSSLQVGRLATMLVFLKDVEEGGETIFPRAILTERGRRKLELVRRGRASDLAEVDSAFDFAWEANDQGEGPVEDIESVPLPSILADLDMPPPSNLTMPRLPSGPLAMRADMKPFCENPDALKFKPKKGHALLWFNHNLELAMDQNTMHGGCSPVNEDKLIAQRWMRFYPADTGNRYYRILQKCGLVRGMQ